MSRSIIGLALLATAAMGVTHAAQARVRWTATLESDSRHTAALVMSVKCGGYDFPLDCVGRFRCYGLGCPLKRGRFRYYLPIGHMEGSRFTLEPRSLHSRRPSCEASGLFVVDPNTFLLAGGYWCWVGRNYDRVDGGTASVQPPPACWDSMC
jgi:hypothetical protein